jgi:hypothetical protein
MSFRPRDCVVIGFWRDMSYRPKGEIFKHQPLTKQDFSALASK